jgi:hypothetical protein
MRLVLLGLLAASSLLLVPPAAGAAAPTRAPALTTDAPTSVPFAIRVRPRTTYRPRTRFAPRRPVRRSPSFRRLGRGILQALGIAYLVNLLFGWGPGGSPFGLLLLLGIVVLLVSRARRRRHAYAARSY